MNGMLVKSKGKLIYIEPEHVGSVVTVLDQARPEDTVYAYLGDPASLSVLLAKEITLFQLIRFFSSDPPEEVKLILYDTFQGIIDTSLDWTQPYEPDTISARK